MRPHQRVHHRVRHKLLRRLAQRHQLPLAVAALVDVDRAQTVDPLPHRRRKIEIRPMHVDELRVAAAIRQLHRMQHGRLRRFGGIRVIGVVALARNVALAVRVEVLVGDVVDLRTIRQRKARVVLREHLAEQLHRIEQLRRRQMLIAEHQHRVLDERTVQPFAHCRVHRLRQVHAADLGAGMRTEGRDHGGMIARPASRVQPARPIRERA